MPQRAKSRSLCNSHQKKEKFQIKPDPERENEK